MLTLLREIKQKKPFIHPLSLCNVASGYKEWYLLAWTEQERINIQIRGCKWGLIECTLRNRPVMLPSMHCAQWNPWGKILKTAGGEPWTVRHQRQHTLGRDQKVGPKQKEMVGSIHGPGIHKEWKGISISITSMWFLVFYSPKLRWQG